MLETVKHNNYNSCNIHDCVSRLIPFVSFLFNQIQLLFKVCHVWDDILEKEILNILPFQHNTICHAWHTHHILITLPDLQQPHQILEANPQGDHPGLDLHGVDLGGDERLDGHVTEDGQLGDAPPHQVEMPAKITSVHFSTLQSTVYCTV